MTPPEFIYFDLGNVLLHFDHHIAARGMAELGGVTPERVWELLFGSDMLRQIETGEVTDREFYEIFCRETNSRPDYDALALAGSAIFTVITPMLPLVTHLRAAGYRLGILSNTSESHWKYVTDGRYALLPGAFEQLILSYEVQSMKPAEKIYRIAAERAGVAPERIFFMDDRLENVEGARRAGFDAVQFVGAFELAKELRKRGVKTNL